VFFFLNDIPPWQTNQVHMELLNACLTAQRGHSETENFILADLFSLVLSQFKKYHIFNILGIFQSLKLRISMEEILSISLKLNFTPNTLGCYGLIVEQ